MSLVDSSAELQPYPLRHVNGARVDAPRRRHIVVVRQRQGLNRPINYPVWHRHIGVVKLRDAGATVFHTQWAEDPLMNKIVPASTRYCWDDLPRHDVHAIVVIKLGTEAQFRLPEADAVENFVAGIRAVKTKRIIICQTSTVG